MRYYLSSTAGTGGRLRESARDFVVKEISVHPPERDGRFTIADVTSINWETNRLVRLLARSMNISRERIGFAGTKDKRAVTTQLMSFECPKENLSNVSFKDLEFSNIYTSNHGIRIGDLIGNEFEIVVRDIAIDIKDASTIIEETASEIMKIGGFPNYFGVQRFGTYRPVTHLVGEAIVRGDLKKAVDIYLSYPSKNESNETIEVRKRLSQCKGDYSSIIHDIPKTMGYEKIMAEHLTKYPEDYKGAILKMPYNLQMMFTHAYQSYLFNIMLSKRMEHGLPLNRPVEGDVVIPLDFNRVPIHENPIITTTKNIDLVTKQVIAGRAFISIILFGADSAFSEGEMGEIERKVIESQNIEKKDFIVMGLSHCTSKGTRREIMCPVKNLNYDIYGDGYSVKFSLPKGNYATCLMREFMKSNMNDY
ncbi:MAG: tRNA pseudouridine(13) synthase TruD [archaeon]|nr:tRNA pseudouridine(13) synthase TruD [archaeon]